MTKKGAVFDRDTAPPAQPVAAQEGKSGFLFQIYSGYARKRLFLKGSANEN